MTIGPLAEIERASLRFRCSSIYLTFQLHLAITFSNIRI